MPPARYPRTARALSPLLPLAMAGVTASSLAAEPPGLDPCRGVEEPRPIAVAELWSEGMRVDPGIRAGAARLEASEASRRALQRSLLPTFEVDGIFNQGQRTSPGEERVLGTGPRGELRVLGSWTLVDGARGTRTRGAAADVAASRADGHAYVLAWQAESARMWARAEAAERQVVELEAHLEQVAAFLPIVERRVGAGVEAPWEARLASEAVARAERRLAEALEARSTGRAELSSIVGACVRPGEAAGLAPGGGPPTAPGSPAGGADGAGPRHPEVFRLLSLAEAEGARGRAAADVDRWSIALLASGGPTWSRAFDPGPAAYEALVGVAGRLRLDPAGVARQERRAADASARALREEADLARERIARELDALAAGDGERERRRESGGLEAERARAALDAARLRWDAGVDGWAPVLQALERDLEARLALVLLEYDLLSARIRRAELLGSMDDLVSATEEAR